jgi:hypothetical protein
MASLLLRIADAVVGGIKAIPAAAAGQLFKEQVADKVRGLKQHICTRICWFYHSLLALTSGW